MDHFSFWIKIPFPFWKFYWNIFWIFFLCFLLFCRNTDYIWKKLLCLFFINIIFLSYNNELLVFIYFCLLLPSYPPLSVLCFHMTLWGVCVCLCTACNVVLITVMPLLFPFLLFLALTSYIFFCHFITYSISSCISVLGYLSF